MFKPGIKFAFFLMLLMLVAGCKEKSAVSENRISDKPESQAAFDSYIKTIESDSSITDSLVYTKFINARNLLEGSEQLPLYRKMGEYFFNNEAQDSALIYFQKGLGLAETFKSEYYTSVFHMMNGIVYNNLSDWEPALSELKSAYDLAITLDSVYLQIRTSRGLGNVYWSTGNYDRALEYYFISLDISQENDFALGIASATNNIGIIYQEVKNYDRAIDYYKQSMTLAEAEGLTRIISIANNNLGDVFSLSGNYDSALVYFTKALEQIKKDYSRFDAGIYLGNIADVFLKTDSLEKSKSIFLESLGFANEIGDKTGITNCNLGLAEVFIKEKNYSKAQEYLKTGTETSEEIGSLKFMEYAYRLYALFYLQKNDYTNSHFFLKKQMSVKDSIYSLENGENVARLESQYLEVQRVKQIELLKEKQKNFRNLSLLGFSAIFIISLLILIAFRQKNKTNLLLKEKNLQIESSREILEEKHKQLIKSQEQLYRINKGKDDFLTIISHDLKNPLSSMRGFTELLIQSYDSFSDEQRKTFLNEVFNSIENISLLINNILYWVRSQTDGINIRPADFDLLKRTNENISIYRLMLVNKEIQLVNKITENITVHADGNVFDMILRNILSNALKFTPAKGIIKISCEKTGSKLKVTVSDNGIGIPEDKLNIIRSRNEQYSTTGTSHEQGTGLGLGLIYRFIEQTGGEFEIDSEPGKGTTISFSLDVVG